MAALSFFLINDLKENMSESFRERGILLAGEFSQKIAEGILIEDIAILEKFISQLCQSKDIHYVYIFDRSGLRLAFKVLLEGIENTSSINTALNNMAIETLSFNDKEHNTLLDITMPVMYDYERIGYIRLGLCLGKIHKRVTARIRNSCILVAAFITLGLVMGFLFSRSLSKPIAQLLEGVKKIRTGDLSHRVKVQKNDEIGELAQSFNRMIDDLRLKTTSIDNLKRA